MTAVQAREVQLPGVDTAEVREVREVRAGAPGPCTTWYSQ